MKALIIEDEPALLAQLKGALEAVGLVVETANNGNEGSWMAIEYPLDLAIVDLGLPDKDGISVIRELRAANREYPVLILTARSRWQDKVEGLEAGADDYLTKPFHTEELVARIRALIRRRGGWVQSNLKSGHVELDLQQQTVTADGDPVSLTAYEYRLLEYLITNAGKVVSKTELTDHIYAEADERDSNVIEVFIRRLRLKLDPTGNRKPIATLRGRGYCWQLERQTG